MTDAEEIAKAIQESARLGEKGLDIADKAASFFAQVLKDPINEISGMITDKLRFVRWKRMVQMAEEVNKILREKKITDTRAVPPKIALPIFEEASLEDDPNLQNLWNHLLANAMNPNFNDELRYGFIEMIKGITGIEAKLLHEFYQILSREGKLRPITDVYQYSLKKEQIIQALGISADVYAISVNNLMRMQLVSPAILKNIGVRMGHEPLTIYKGIDAVTLTPLGIKFVEACIK
ncbi:MAG: Abi-alpha family protein [Candidatus Hydrogenedentes bacterium]|nr:Abi-alpha family protein [Candidatus Hydrogenedentota bacterium]